VLIFSLRLFLPWAKRHQITSLVVPPPPPDTVGCPPKKIVRYVHGDNKRGARQPSKPETVEYETASQA
jgi:hypothetical protein